MLKQKQVLLKSEPADFFKKNKHQLADHQQDVSVKLLQETVENLKKKALSRKNSLKIMYEILTGKEKENEKLRIMVDESKNILIAFCEEANRLYSEKSEEIAAKVQDSLVKLESLHRKMKRASSQERTGLRSQPKSKSTSRPPETRDPGFLQADQLIEDNQNLQLKVRLLETELASLKQSKADDHQKPKQKVVSVSKNPYVDQSAVSRNKEDQALIADLKEKLLSIGNERDSLLLEVDARSQDVENLQTELATLRDAVGAKNQSIQQLQSALKTKDQDIAAKTAEVQRANLEAKNLASQLKTITAEQDTLIRDRDNALKAAESLETNLNALKQDYSRLTAANEKAASDKRVLATQLEQTESHLKDLKEKLNTASSISPQLVQLEAALTATTQELKSEKDLAAETTRQLATLKNQLLEKETELQDQKRALQRATKERDTTRENLEGANKNLENRMSSLKQKNEEMLAQLDEKDAQIRVLEGSNSELEKEKTNLQLILKNFSSDKDREAKRVAAETKKIHDGFSLKLEALNKQILELTEELEAKNTELLQQQDRTRQALAEEKEKSRLELLEAKKQAQKKLEETIRQSNASKAEELARVQTTFNGLLEDKEADVAALKSQIDQLTAQVNESTNTEAQISFAKHKELLGLAEAKLKESLTSLSRLQLQMKSDLETKQEIISDLKTLLLKIMDVIGAQTTEEDKADDFLEKASKQLQSLRGELDKTKTDHKKLKDAAATQASKISQLELDNKNLKEEITKFNEQVDKEKSEVQNLSDKIIKAHEETKKSHEAQIKTLNKQIDDLKEQTKKLELKSAEADQKLEEAHKLQYKLQIEKKKVQEIEEINKSEFERLSDSVIQAKEEIETLKNRNERLKTKNESLDKSLKAIEEEAKQLREKNKKLAADSEKDQATFNSNLSSKLEEINRLTSENERLKAKVDKLKETVTKLEEKAAGSNSNHSPSLTTENGKPMAEIREADEHEEVDEKQQIKQLTSKVESQHLTIKDLRSKISSLETMLHGGKNPKEDGKPTIEDMGLDQLKSLCQDLQSKNAELAASLKVSIEELDKVRADCKRHIELERRDKDNQIHILDQNLESVEANYLRELNDKNRLIAKMQEDLQECAKDKDRAIFYVKKEQESVNIAKSEEIEHLRRIVTENSNNPNDSGVMGEGRSVLGAGADTYRKQISHLESIIREFEKKEEDYAKLKAKYNKLLAELEEQTKKSRRSISHLDNLAQRVNETLQDSYRHNTQNLTDKDEPADHLVDELKQRVEMLEESNRKIKLELEKELEVRKQFLNEYDYIRTESDYRITNEDIETLRSERVKLSQEDRGLFIELQTLVADRFGLKKDLTKDNIVKQLAKQLDKLAFPKDRDDAAPKDLEGLQIENTQLKKQVTSLTTQYDHLKGVLVQKDRELRSGSSGGATLANQLADLINHLLASLEMKPLEALEVAKVKEAFAQISKSRKKLLSEVRVKEELIEDLRINSLKVSSEREQHNSGSFRAADDHSKMRELLVKYHNVRKKLEASLSDLEKLQLDKENLTFEIEDLKKTLELEAKNRESIEIQLSILRQPAATDLSADIKEHLRKLFGEFFKTLVESRDQSQANQILEVLTSIIGYSAEDKNRLFDSIKKSKLFDKILKKK